MSKNTPSQSSGGGKRTVKDYKVCGSTEVNDEDDFAESFYIKKNIIFFYDTTSKI
jgi:hypothetical protein